LKNIVKVPVIIIVIVVVFLIFYNSGKSEDQDFECQSSEQCFPSTCCHASSCVPKSEKPDCSGVVCTLTIEPGTADVGSCECINNKCELVIL
jgi:hypothetical protein